MAKGSKCFYVSSLLAWCVLFLLATSDNLNGEKDTVENQNDKDYVGDNEEGEARRETTVR